MIEDLTRAEYEAVLRHDFATFVVRCFHELNPQAELAMNWHIEVIAARADRGAARQDPPPHHQFATAPPQVLDGLGRLSRLVSRARPVGPDPVRQLRQDLADKLAAIAAAS